MAPRLILARLPGVRHSRVFKTWSCRCKVFFTPNAATAHISIRQNGGAARQDVLVLMHAGLMSAEGVCPGRVWLAFLRLRSITSVNDFLTGASRASCEKDLASRAAICIFRTVGHATLARRVSTTAAGTASHQAVGSLLDMSVRAQACHRPPSVPQLDLDQVQPRPREAVQYWANHFHPVSRRYLSD